MGMNLSADYLTGLCHGLVITNIVVWSIALLSHRRNKLLLKIIDTEKRRASAFFNLDN